MSVIDADCNKLFGQFYSMATDAVEKIKFFVTVIEEAQSFPFLPTSYTDKNVEKSRAARKKGNALFGKREYMAALEAYNGALCFAPIGTESLGLVYGNRSAIYLDAGFYGFCLENIKLALDHNYPDHLKQKLIQRKEICMEKMKTEKDSFDIYGNLNIPKLSYPANPRIPFMIDALKCVKDERFGRHIVTTRDLHPGDIVLVEEPFVKTVQADTSFCHCYNCGRNNFFNLKPCPNSSKVMFCSIKCANEAWDRYYKYEVNIVDDLLMSKCPLPAIRATFNAFTMVKDVDELKDLIASIDVENETAFNLDWTRASEKDKFRALYSLACITLPDVPGPYGLHDLHSDIAYLYWKLRPQEEFKNLIKNDEHENLFLNLWLRLCLITKLNRHQLSERFVKNKDRELAPVDQGEGINVLFSLVSHSCCPNVRRIRVGQSFAVLVIRPIKAGEQIFDSYGVHYSDDSLAERKIFLSAYHFECKCEACIYDFKAETPQDVRLNVVPQEIRPLLGALAYFPFDEQMSKAVVKLDEWLPEIITEGQKYYPDKSICDLEKVLSICKEILIYKMPLNMILAPKKSS